MRIGVVGTGYVGLVAGACFADSGNSVVCCDIDSSKIDRLSRGEIPIFEPGLETLVQSGIQRGSLRFTASTDEVVGASEVIFLAVGTPPGPDGQADLGFLDRAVRSIGRAMREPLIIVNKSTVPVGTHRKVREWLSEATRVPFEVASNPEFLKEGSAVDDFMKPDRVIVGTEKKEVYEKLAALYSPFVRQGNPILWMDPVSAEITKYACNAYLATRVSFINEVATFCSRLGGDVDQVRKGMTTDSRIGRHFLYPGIGYGGSCFPKDIRAFLATARQVGLDLKIAAAAEEVNARQKRLLADLMQENIPGGLGGKTVAVWGIAFKPNTDDLRDAPALVVIERLLELGAKVRAYDPVAGKNARERFGSRVEIVGSSYEAAQGADALAIATEWNEFRHPDFERLKRLLKAPLVFDGRNLYSVSQMEQLGFRYFSIGRALTSRDLRG